MLAVVELSFQPLLLYFFTINTYIYCPINYRICIQSYTTCLELAELMVYIYGVYVDIIKFHPLGTSPLLWFVSSTHCFLSKGWLVYCIWGMVYYLLWWNNVVTMQFPVKPLLTDMIYTTFAEFHKYPLLNKTTISLTVEYIFFL